jgi:tRNA modification GTPase
MTIGFFDKTAGSTWLNPPDLRKPEAYPSMPALPPTDTIFALSSGAGRAGVAVVRMSGPRTRDALTALAGPLPKARFATLRTLQAQGERGAIDRALVLWFPGPASYTGEDMAELHVHGGRAVVEALLSALGAHEGLRLAEPGEFTRRAFLNGKLDLTAAEGIADLIDAETEAQRRQAQRQASGVLDTLYEGWRNELIEAMALLEAALDFADEGDVPEDVMAPAWEGLARLSSAISAHLADGRRGEILRDGLHVVLAGAPNAGKSSLLNALARRDVAIVSPEAGTTRDVIEVRLDLGGLPVILSDTAGVRPAHDMDKAGAVETEGIRRTLARAGAGDLIVWVMDAGAPQPEPPPEIAARAGDLRWVLNKADLLARGTEVSAADAGISAQNPLAISALEGTGLDALVSLLTAAAHDRMGDLDAPIITRARHRQELERCRSALLSAVEGDRTALELRAEDVRLAATALGRITGRVDVEDILDRIFASFCIGK